MKNRYLKEKMIMHTGSVKIVGVERFRKDNTFWKTKRQMLTSRTEKANAGRSEEEGRSRVVGDYCVRNEGEEGG